MLMRITLLAVAALFGSAAGNATQTGWQVLPPYSMHDLANGSAIEKALSDAPRKFEPMGSVGLSLPDGRHTITVTFRVTLGRLSWIYRCIDFYDKEMSPLNQVCYEARPPKLK